MLRKCALHRSRSCKAAAALAVILGNRIAFANVAQDADLMAEPRPSGAEFPWQLARGSLRDQQP